jgi:uncharacterized repeat protein (TIGR03847 family)
MGDDLHDFGVADLFDVEAIGRPGERRFRVFARSGRATASLWLEREHLDQLSMAIDELLARVTGGAVLRPEAMAEVVAPPGAPRDFPARPDVEFQVAAMQIGYDDERELVLLRAAPLEVVEEDGEAVARADVEMAFSAFITRLQAARVSAHILSILASGRPRCPFCGRPMEKPHLCEKQNGYHPVVVN